MSSTVVPPASRLTATSSPANNSSKLTLWPLVAATFFMVSGGTYGTEDIIHGAGYSRGLLILFLTPLVWSLPVAFMVGELSTALPHEGGYYTWVRRAMGDFWGFQEAWLSLASSFFDMAIYPALFVVYFARLFPGIAEGRRGILIGLAMITICSLLNIAGVRVVGATSLWLFVLLSAPFALIVVLAPFKAGQLAGAVTTPATSSVGLLGGLLIAMWNYMGWDSASTIAGEVHEPKRTYPRAIFLAVLVVALSYILPIAAIQLTGIPASAWETGSWADLASLVSGTWLRVVLVLGGMLSAFGMFNALVLSYSRLPYAMALEGMLPRVFSRSLERTGAPWVSILACAIAWAGCLGLGFERLVLMDVILCGLSLVLEFVALVVLRVREPNLPRPFRVPGGMPGAVLVGVGPVLLLAFAMFHADREQVFGMNALVLGFLLIVAGMVAYPLARVRGPAAVRADSAAE
ncbi:MAG: APC family permease [Acidobacteria bacterium]|nr:APC family permease [Acidobacteriota bacterium]MCL5287916.1 APC family permease [Acidobacteriota bacterium]